MHWSADHLISWRDETSQVSVHDALQYYVNTVGTDSVRYTRVLFGVGSMGATILAFKMISGFENNWLFDGACLFLVAASTVLYHTKIVPNIELLPPSIPKYTGENHTNMLQPLRELAGAHMLLSVALVGIVLLQCGKYYSERLQEREWSEEVDARLVRRLRQLHQAERSKGEQVAAPGAPVESA
ncbi:hypothetical protein MVES1_000424 [Malassezia vespertilionis]|uniref:uncharacterized protein n=1 Tax=Malassezia vespertilionis TaxID=2020962 RepID=UPI0024B1C873|nr:uncharacterized protein MVES1_000424 [Malassezia vespertilionis]WFD05098.1 hypothetical protein MVES1_000424 [Malassezia vespertilionis]